jgi:putative addiction module component (TIGR02574 family)
MPLVSPRFAELRDEALQLPEQDRLRLAEELFESVEDGGPLPDLSPAWKAEIVRRVERLKRGEVTALDGDEVYDRLRAKYAR